MSRDTIITTILSRDPIFYHIEAAEQLFLIVRRKIKKCRYKRSLRPVRNGRYLV